jgi:S1-C subfamily serine protease
VLEIPAGGEPFKQLDPNEKIKSLVVIYNNEEISMKDAKFIYFQEAGPDIAVLEIPALAHKGFLTISSKAAKEAEPVFLVGFPALQTAVDRPLNEKGRFIPREKYISFGNVADTERFFMDNDMARENWTELNLHELETRGGNSGGPILDAKGEVRGIVKGVVGTGQEFSRSSSGIDASTILQLLKKIRHSTKIKRPTFLRAFLN